MTENQQADCVQSRQAGFVRCCLKYKIAPSADFPDRQGDFSMFRVSYSSVMPTVICRQPIPSRNQNMGA